MLIITDMIHYVCKAHISHSPKKNVQFVISYILTCLKMCHIVSFALCSLLLVGVSLLPLYQCDFTSVISGELHLAISDIQLPFDEALTACADRNMTLLSVDSDPKDRVLVDLLNNGGSNVTLPATQSWIAAREVSEGVWINVLDNQPLYYTRWFSDQPDDVDNLSCAFQHTLFLLYWRDGNCSAPFFFICEATITTTTPSPYILPLH